MSRVIDLSAHGGGPYEPLKHPAGVSLPFDGPSDAALIVPELRSEIRSGAYDADMIALLDAAVQPGDRVLVIGAGLGVLTTLIAKREGVERVIAVEANTALVPYMERTHALNGAEGIEVVNAVLAEGKTGRVPFFARRDIRTSSLLPHDRSWQQVMMVPFMDLNLILAEERISLVVSEIPVGSAELLARAELDRVERVLLNVSDDSAAAWADGGICALLVARGYVPEVSGTAVLLSRAGKLGEEPAAAEEEETGPEEAGPEDTDLDEDLEEEAEAEEAEEPTGEAPEAPGRAAPEGGPPVGGPARAPAPPVAKREREAPETATPEGARRPAEERAAPRPGEPEAAAPEEGAPAPGEPDTGRTERGEADRRARRARAADEAAEEPAPAPAPARRRAVNGGRVLWGLVVLALLLALPLMLLGWFAAERGGSRSAATQAISAAWGGPQTLTGPFLLVPVAAANGEPAAPLVLLPETLEVVTTLDTERRRRGVFETLVYRSESELHVAARPNSAAALVAPDETARWSETVLAVGISDPTALARARLLSGPEPLDFEPGSGVAGVPGIRARIGDPRGQGGRWSFVLGLKGSEAFRMTPAGGTTHWRLHADWPHPVFLGDFVPTLREIGADGFVAEWRVPELAHGLPRAFRGAEPIGTLGQRSFGAELVQPVDLYRTAQRAAKLGLLVIVLTFGTVFLLERRARQPVRLVHYALIGIAQCAFFLLLLALAEHIGFGPAYAVVTVTTVALLTAYAWHGLALGPPAGWMTLALALLYAVLYPLLLGAELALLMGAVLAFLVIAGLMWGTSTARRNGGR